MSKTLTLPRVISSLLALVLMLSLSYAVLAQDLPAGRQDPASPAGKRAEIKQKIENKKAQIATREAALKAKLQSFKDQKKATAAARISENLNKINDRQTGQMLKHLDKMTSILNRLEAKDPNLARQAIASASAAIASASAAVAAQAEKDYTLNISAESKARVEAQTMRQRLHEDLKAIRQMVIEAKQAVANAIRVAKSNG